MSTVCGNSNQRQSRSVPTGSAIHCHSTVSSPMVLLVVLCFFVGGFPLVLPVVLWSCSASLLLCLLPIESSPKSCHPLSQSLSRVWQSDNSRSAYSHETSSNPIGLFTACNNYALEFQRTEPRTPKMSDVGARWPLPWANLLFYYT